MKNNKPPEERAELENYVDEYQPAKIVYLVFTSFTWANFAVAVCKPDCLAKKHVRIILFGFLALQIVALIFGCCVNTNLLLKINSTEYYDFDQNHYLAGLSIYKSCSSASFGDAIERSSTPYRGEDQSSDLVVVIVLGWIGLVCQIYYCCCFAGMTKAVLDFGKAQRQRDFREA